MWHTKDLRNAKIVKVQEKRKGMEILIKPRKNQIKTLIIFASIFRIE